MASPLKLVDNDRADSTGQLHHSADCAASRLRTVIRRCTCVWLTAYSERYVKPPPMTSVNQVCRFVGSGSKLSTKKCQ